MTLPFWAQALTSFRNDTGFVRASIAKVRAVPIGDIIWRFLLGLCLVYFVLTIFFFFFFFEKNDLFDLTVILLTFSMGLVLIVGERFWISH